MGLKPHEQRVVTERDELSEKLEKLNPFLDSEIFKGLGPVDQELLVQQRNVMREYLAILNLRIGRFTE